MTENDDTVNMNTSELLMTLIERTSELREAVRGIDGRLAELSTNANAQLATLQERMGRVDTVLDVHESRLNRMDRDMDETCGDIDEVRTSVGNVRQEVADLKLRLYVLIAVLSAGGGLAGGLIGKLLGL